MQSLCKVAPQEDGIALREVEPREPADFEKLWRRICGLANNG